MIVARGGTASPDPADAREQAREILSGRPFHEDPPPRPLRGVLEWLGDVFAAIGRWFAEGPIGDAVSAVVRWIAAALEPVGAVLQPLPGPTWIVPLAALTALLTWLLVRYTSRPGAPLFGRSGARLRSEGFGTDDPDDLEREAERAEQAGDLDEALRLRFRAGLLRLDSRGAIAFRPSLTTGEVRRLLGSATFDELATAFEEVAYGGRPAEPPDVENARRAWTRVLEEAGR